ncbi:hypothetical protein HK100_007747 [Physocladia obscura]|uniref:Uncharacterized protein n=1 Tax=Physocladia obscura TaxID=109957 RepID=A0AAD5T4P5_9FUNG|nr:hypothetical protein HK100_007747 [Physocladia obscura]
MKAQRKFNQQLASRMRSLSVEETEALDDDATQSENKSAANSAWRVVKKGVQIIFG